MTTLHNCILSDLAIIYYKMLVICNRSSANILQISDALYNGNRDHIER